MISFGHFLKERYMEKRKLLSPTYNHREIRVQSKNKRRTMVAIKLIVATMYSNVTIDLKSNYVLNPIPIHSYSLRTDYLLNTLSACYSLRYSDLDIDIIKRIIKLKTKYKKIFIYVSLQTKKKFTLQNIYDFYKDLEKWKLTGEILTDKLMKNYNMTHTHFDILAHLVHVFNSEKINLAKSNNVIAGYLLHHFIESFENFINKNQGAKMELYGGSYNTIFYLAIYFNNYIIPSYNANIIIELLQKNDNITKDYFVRIMYYNYNKRYYLSPKGCDPKVPSFDCLRTAVEDFRVRDINKICGYSFSHYPYVTLILVIIIIFGILLIILSIILWKKYHLILFREQDRSNISISELERSRKHGQKNNKLKKKFLQNFDKNELIEMRKRKNSLDIKISNNLNVYLSKMTGSSDSQCIICMEEYSGNPQIIRLGIINACGHFFDFDCIWSWLERKNQCPLCRKIVNFNENDIKAITMKQMLIERKLWKLHELEKHSGAIVNRGYESPSSESLSKKFDSQISITTLTKSFESNSVKLKRKRLSNTSSDTSNIVNIYSSQKHFKKKEIPLEKRYSITTILPELKEHCNQFLHNNGKKSLFYSFRRMGNKNNSKVNRYKPSDSVFYINVDTPYLSKNINLPQIHQESKLNKPIGNLPENCKICGKTYGVHHYALIVGRLISCKHVFHYSCIYDYAIANNKCYICNHPINNINKELFHAILSDCTDLEEN
ncbi:hypothetical protein A3Q56_06598 [Intoshia linei]|uniref:RING-type domain-containing protein n=1 Tax=Intoshia linei TaxID=1819745 RepID=A0A177AV37_9BILA|nr:hypothetical protein A3Q56_06598 [Intoshia linei]